jgi:hypothetical protein
MARQGTNRIEVLDTGFIPGFGAAPLGCGIFICGKYKPKLK